MHGRGISHRDLKLTNILIDKDQKIKIIDFGFADNTGRILHAYCCTPSYMAPEIICKKEYRGIDVGIWAIGVVLYKLLTGEYAFGSNLIN